MSEDFQITGKNTKALFSLKAHRGEGMVLLAMNWRAGQPPDDFVGFGIEYREPNGDRFFAVRNRLNFRDKAGKLQAGKVSSLKAPIQKFRWVHLPRQAELAGAFTYRVTPLFMNDEDELTQGASQEIDIELSRETYPGKLNVTFTRGFVSSQAFVERYESFGAISKLLPKKSADGVTFKPTHPKADEALSWMGFEARAAILDLLDEAMLDKAEVRVVAFDLSEATFVERLVKLKKRLHIIIDDSKEHGEKHSGESQAAKLLENSAGTDHVLRQHCNQLQHNKLIVVDGPKVKAVVYGSTNFSWRGFYVQANNAVIVRGVNAIKPARAAFDNYWRNTGTPGDFGNTESADWSDLGVTDLAARVTFSPHSRANALLDEIARDVEKTKSSLFFSLAFLFQTPGAIRDAIDAAIKNDTLFVYGISDKKLGGLDVLKPDGNIRPVFPAALSKNVPAPFSEEPTGGMGTRMHHKFIVIDFDKPSARVYLGSYNFSHAADVKNGENLLEIRDRRIAVSYMVEAVRLFDAYRFRVAQAEAKAAKHELALTKPPRKPTEKPWWETYYTNKRKICDRELFS
jgi:phosphatidylserine/phosphatidylglycerophosphate/cardiolipin synthase-like enzyme